MFVLISSGKNNAQPCLMSVRAILVVLIYFNDVVKLNSCHVNRVDTDRVATSYVVSSYGLVGSP